ncbi:alpha/beta fold hydrolase [Paraburkholderia sp. HD33-4]|uniref:alpha/beta fold hydrolase n=1 Tax=Paraburkholderia sp. HD33-4 TaxID=2883242 RepID=UPI001F32EF64|nr:alpha/beta hydrolase [Paraburkholderia sp. HD33-4]
MAGDINQSRRTLLGVSVLGLIASQLGTIASANAQESNNNRIAAPGTAGASKESFGPLKHVNAGVLSIAYAEAGPADGPPVLLFHGWPYDIHSYADVAPILAAAGYRVLVPYLRGYGETRFLSASTPRNGQPAAVAVDAISFMDALKIDKAVVGGFDWGGRNANLLAFLWPERVKALVSVSGYLVGSQAAAGMPLPPAAENAWWYLFYFATDRGQTGYARNTKEFNRFIWHQASPKWAFDDETFERSARAFENPDFVTISLYNYRWYLRLEPGERKYDGLEKKIATFPSIACPTITLEGDSNGAPHPDPSVYAKKYVGKYEHRTITGGIGHNLPQEAPAEFAKAIIDVDKA